MNTTNEQLQQYLQFAQEFLVRKGDYVMSQWQNLEITKLKKEGADLVTNFDLEIEREFAELVLNTYPEHGFSGEDLPELKRSGEYIWQIDPIDGTKFFAKGVPIWCTTAVLTHNGDPLVGVVYNAVTKQLYTAIKGGGAYLNGEKMEVTDMTDLAKVQIAGDQAYSFAEMPMEVRARVQKEIATLQNNVYRLRVLGSGTYSVTWVAQGFFAAYIDTYRPEEKFVDILGPMLIATEAGAEVYREKIDEKHEKFIIAAPQFMSQLKSLLIQG